MSRNYVYGTQIEVVEEPEARGRFRHVLLDFDGTVSLLREGWPKIMAPVMVEMICGDAAPTEAIRARVDEVIAETTGVQTIVQMERLVELVREYGLVPPDQIRDAMHYKQVYNDRLMVPVRERIARIASGETPRDDMMLRGARRFLDELSARRGVTLYIFSGTDRDDVRNEASVLGVDHYFDGGIWGSVGTLEDYSKEKVLRELFAEHGLHGTEVLVIGDGPVEIQNGRDIGCVTVGVASDEATGFGWDAWKRERLIRAGANVLVPDFSEAEALAAYLFPAEED